MDAPFYKRIWKKPPTVFPYIALFHIVLLLYFIKDTVSSPEGMELWTDPVIMLAYTVFWIFCCDLKRWAALGYIALTTINLALHMTVMFELVDHMALEKYVNILFPADTLFTFFVMFYFKNFK